MTMIYLVESSIASHLVVIIKAVLICLAFKLHTAFERIHLVLKVTVLVIK